MPKNHTSFWFGADIHVSVNNRGLEIANETATIKVPQQAIRKLFTFCQAANQTTPSTADPLVDVIVCNPTNRLMGEYGLFKNTPYFALGWRFLEPEPEEEGGKGKYADAARDEEGYIFSSKKVVFTRDTFLDFFSSFRHIVLALIIPPLRGFFQKLSDRLATLKLEETNALLSAVKNLKMLIDDAVKKHQTLQRQNELEVNLAVKNRLGTDLVRVLDPQGLFHNEEEEEEEEDAEARATLHWMGQYAASNLDLILALCHCSLAV